MVEFKADSSASFSVLYKDDDRMVIWGPASVEMVDKENDRITAEALENALPQLLKRKRLSLEHTDQLVGDILKGFETEEPITVEIDGETFERSSFPTDVLYPEEDGVAHKGLYVAGEVYNDSRQAKEAREDIKNGTLNSYSISGEAIESSTRVKDGELVDDIESMDLSAVTLCEEGMNQKSKFALFDSGKVTAVAKQALAKAMTEKEEGTDESSVEEDAPDNVSEAAGMDKSELQAMFRSAAEDVLKEHLPDGEIATKEDFDEWSSESTEVKEDEEDEEFEAPEAEDEPDESKSLPLGASAAQSKEEDEEMPPFDDEEDEEEEKAMDDVTGRIEAAAAALGKQPGELAQALFSDEKAGPMDEMEDEEVPPEVEEPEEEVLEDPEDEEGDVDIDVDVEDDDDPLELDDKSLDVLKDALPEDLYRGVTEHLSASEAQPMSDPEEKEDGPESESTGSEEGAIDKSADTTQDLDGYLDAVASGGMDLPSEDTMAKSFEHEGTDIDGEDDPTGALGNFYNNQA